MSIPLRFEATLPAPKEGWTPANLMGALESVATDHAKLLHIDHDRIYAEYGCLWMVVRSRLELRRNLSPEESLTLHSRMRAPSAVMSIRDFDLFVGEEAVGKAMQYWVLVNAESRSIADLRTVKAVFDLPTAQPESTDTMRRIKFPKDLPLVGKTVIRPEEIDDNGHLNNVSYVRLAQAYAPDGTTGLEISFDHECFVGEELTFYAAEGCVRGRKTDGTDSFHMRFYYV